MSGVVIRRATPHDAFAVGAMHVQLGREGGAGAEPGFLDRYVDAWLTAHADHPAFLAEADKVPIGLAQVRIVRGLPRLGARPEQWAELTTVFVTPQLRHGGIGGRLVREVHRWCAGEGVSRVVVSADVLGAAAPGLARALGAHPAGSAVYEARLQVPTTLF